MAPEALVSLRVFRRGDTDALVALWHACGLTRPWNDPYRDIERKLAVDPELLVVGERGDEIVASIMIGYEGHRGWINYLAVAPGCQRQGIGRRLMAHAEEALRERGCPKINLMIRDGNTQAMAFYRRLGYVEDAATALGKRLEADG